MVRLHVAEVGGDRDQLASRRSTRHAASRAALHLEGHAPRRRRAAGASRARAAGAIRAPGSSTRATFGWLSSQRASSSAAADCACMRSSSVSRPFRITQALNGESVGPAVRRKREHRARDQVLAARRPRRRARAPARRGTWWPNGSRGRRRARAAAAARACRTRCRPRAARPPSSRSPRAPRCRRSRSADWTASRGRAAWCSCRHRALPLVELGRRDEGRLDAEPPRIWSKSCTVAPNTAFEHTTWSPRLQQRHRGGEDRRHARGGGDAGLRALERGEPVLEHRHRGIGEARVDHARARSPVKRAAACAAFSKTKLEVRNSASECSLELAARAARRARPGWRSGTLWP